MKKVLSLLLVVLVLTCIIIFVSCDDDNTTTTTTITTTTPSIAENCKHDNPEKIVVVEAQDPTCQETGITEGMKCLNCDTMVVPQRILKTIDCIESDWIVDMEATETENGAKHTECTMCGKTIAEDILPRLEYTITLWVSTTEGVKEFIEEQVDAFKALHPEYEFEIIIKQVAEGDVSYLILSAPDSTPDMYCFAQDQIARLVQAKALAPLGVTASDTVSDENDAGSVAAATVNGQLYAYPITSDNGYFLYYDSSIVSDEEAKTLEGIIAACKREGKKFGYAIEDGWYMSSFFFAQPVSGGAPLCTSSWVYSDDYKYPIAINDTFNSENGMIAMKAMNMLTTSGVWKNTSYCSSDIAAFVSGIWNASSALEEYGDNMRAVKLPTFTVDSETYQLGSFSGYKFIGCKPQEDERKAKICSELALYLSSEEEQLGRYYEFGWLPSNIEAQNEYDVMTDPVLKALVDQNKFAQPQGMIDGRWWDISGKLATASYEDKNGEVTVETMKNALTKYENEINEIIRSYQ